jgi:hypothetical protein
VFVTDIERTASKPSQNHTARFKAKNFEALKN